MPSHASSVRAMVETDKAAEPAASPSKAARRVIRALSNGSRKDTALLRRLLAGRGPADRGFELLAIGVEPIDLGVGIEGAGARVPEDLGIVDPGWHRAVLGKGAGDGQEPAARACDHDVARRQMLLGVIDDRPHAFGDSLVLHHDVADAGIDLVGAL